MVEVGDVKKAMNSYEIVTVAPFDETNCSWNEKKTGKVPERIEAETEKCAVN